MFLIGGGAVAAGAVWYASRKSQQTADAIREAIKDVPLLDQAPSDPNRGRFAAHLTGYWPFTAREDERKMEGGINDRRGNRLHTLEQHLADPVAHPFVSVAGDDQVFPYGQRLEISAWPGRTFRVVDTGGHFRGAGKLYRVLGEEPLDICVDSSKTIVPKKGITARIIPGDNFERGKAVATSGIKSQNVVLGYDGETCRDALARALESELGGRPTAEQHAAGWALRNRALAEGKTMAELLAPKGTYGSPGESGGFVSTKRTPSPRSIEIADAVLGADDEHDPTGGANDFWVPEQQARLHQLGDVHRAAQASGNAAMARQYVRYAGFAPVDTVRAGHALRGIETLGAIGTVELLRKTR
jgi:hypothetical protein